MKSPAGATDGLGKALGGRSRYLDGGAQFAVVGAVRANHKGH
jgi:hypothetical protein